MSQKIELREAENTDLPQLSELFNEYRIFYSKETDFLGAKKFLENRLKEKDSKIFVAQNNAQKLVGFVQLYPLFSSTRMKKLWLLNDLFINEKSRGKGISVKLIEKAKTLVKNTEACALFLETEKTNIIGNNLYHKTGFKLNTESNFYEWNNNKL